ncbi:MAG: hypothetical protein JOZ87_40250, partial [Chloroflexi bacterium]|nr:hypothetical protein [Chloroflexota bacterium]
MCRRSDPGRARSSTYTASAFGAWQTVHRLGTVCACIGQRRPALAIYHVGGVVFADLTPLREAALVPTTVADAFGLAGWDGRPPLEQALRVCLHGQRTLLLLDNCEQVLAGARLVGRLLD